MSLNPNEFAQQPSKGFPQPFPHIHALFPSTNILLDTSMAMDIDSPSSEPTTKKMPAFDLLASRHNPLNPAPPLHAPGAEKTFCATFCSSLTSESVMSTPSPTLATAATTLMGPGVTGQGFKTLKDSRWANDDAPPAQTGEKTGRRKRTRRRRKTMKKKEEEEEEEEEASQRDTPRVLMDMEEFAREVEMYNLKTLKDSRWAD